MLHTFSSIHEQFDGRRRRAHLTQAFPYRLALQMRAAKVTIRQLAGAMAITQKRVRALRAERFVPYLVALDCQQAIEQVVRDRQLAAAKAALPASWRKHVWASDRNWAEVVRLAGLAS